jgi:hypothetical protein
MKSATKPSGPVRLFKNQSDWETWLDQGMTPIRREFGYD